MTSTRSCDVIARRQRTTSTSAGECNLIACRQQQMHSLALRVRISGTWRAEKLQSPLQFFVAPMPLLIHITLIHIAGAC